MIRRFQVRLLMTLASCVLGICAQAQAQATPELMRVDSEPGRIGGRLVVGQSPEPKSFNPVFALDQPTQDVLRRMNADLIHINRASGKTEPALAKSWTASKDGKSFTVQLRKGIQFSDGAPFDADDVVFSYHVYLDEKLNSPQRGLLLIGDKPMMVEKLSPYSVRFSFASPYAAAERVFDSIPILPRHLLEKEYAEGKLAQAWALSTSAQNWAGLGPFRLKQASPGDRIVLERNPYYWKIDSKGQKLPYLDELIFLIVPSRDAQVVRFQANDTQVIAPLSAENYAALMPEQQARHYNLYDAGPGMEYNFLLFNLNDDTAKLPEVVRRQVWFKGLKFRQAVSMAIDRKAMVRLVYQNRATPLATHVTPGKKQWVNATVQAPEYSVAKARELLKSGGYTWKGDSLLDTQGKPVEFTILASASNALRSQMATLIQSDLKALGINAHVVTMEFRSMLDRIQNSHDYEAAVMGLSGPDDDPNPDMTFVTSDGPLHLWHLHEKPAPGSWQAELDHLMAQQLITLDHAKRKKLYDRVQEIMGRELPVVFLVSPNILGGAQADLGNLRPAIIDSYLLWNADEIYWRTPAGNH